MIIKNDINLKAVKVGESNVRRIHIGSDLVWAQTEGINAFIIRVKTDNAGTSASNQFTLPLHSIGGLTYDFVADWGDGTLTHHAASTSVTHSFTTAGTYDIKIYGKFEKIYFNNGGDRLKLLKVLQWGDSYGKFANQLRAFNGCANLDFLANDCANINAFVTNAQEMFYECTSLVVLPSGVTFSNVTNASNMFYGCSSLVELPSGVTFSNVTNASNMFYGCSSLVELPSGVTFGNVTNASNMLRGCTSFNQDLSSWDVSSVRSFGQFMWGGNVPATLVTDFSQWTFNKDVNFGLFVQFMPGARVFTAERCDVFLQKLAASVIGTSRNPSISKNIGFPSIQCTAVGKVYYDALVADGWTFTYGITVV